VPHGAGTAAVVDDEVVGLVDVVGCESTGAAAVVVVVLGPPLDTVVDDGGTTLGPPELQAATTTIAATNGIGRLTVPASEPRGRPASR
jgi:hypothetical protein